MIVLRNLPVVSPTCRSSAPASPRSDSGVAISSVALPAVHILARGGDPQLLDRYASAHASAGS